MANATRTRRTRNLVDHRVQFGFAKIIISYLFLYTVFLILMFAVPISFIVYDFPGTETEMNAAVGKFMMGDSTFWGLLIVFIVLIAVHSIIMTQRFAGPIFVFRRHLTRLKNGELSRMQLRKRDQLQDVKNLLNEHIDQLGEFMTSYGSSLESLESIIEDMESRQIDVAHLQKELNRLQDIREKGWHYSA
ncbi:MAG TPA: hypothetical protein PLV45_02715 [bacterium]|nr:hypothetical protein [bacterium]